MQDKEYTDEGYDSDSTRVVDSAKLDEPELLTWKFNSDLAQVQRSYEYLAATPPSRAAPTHARTVRASSAQRGLIRGRRWTARSRTLMR